VQFQPERAAIAVLAIAVALIVVVLDGGLLFPYVVAKHLYLRGVILLGLIALCVACVVDVSRCTMRFTPLVYCLLCVLFLSAFAALLGVDPKLSLVSTFERMEGILGQIYWLGLVVLLAMILKSVDDWRSFFHWQLLASSLIGLLAMIYQLTSFSAGTTLFYSPDATRLSVGWGNPGYSGLYAACNCLLAFGLASSGISGSGTEQRKDWCYRGVIGLSLLINFWVLSASDTRGAMLAFCVALGSLVMLMIAFRCPVVGVVIRTRGRWLIALLVGIISILAAGLCLWIFTAESEFTNQLASIFDSRNDTVLIRFKVWGIALQAIAERPLLGWGPENFVKIFALYEPDTANIPREFDRVHNIYLESMLGVGLLGFTAWIVTLLYGLGKALNICAGDSQPDQGVALGLIGVLLCYLIQGMFWPDSLVGNIYLAIFLGYVISREIAAPEVALVNSNGVIVRNGIRVIPVFCILVLLMGLRLHVLQPYQLAKDTNAQARGQQAGEEGLALMAIHLTAGSLPAETTTIFLKQLGDSFENYSPANREFASDQIKELGSREMASEFPHWKILVMACYAANKSLAHSPALDGRTIAWLDRLIDLAPNRPEIIQLRGYQLLLAGEHAQANSLVDEYLSRNPTHTEKFLPFSRATR
jgi:O-antigen ligase